ncbi:MAG: M23 family metallopeptidase [Gemmatimonadales bacterium]
MKQRGVTIVVHVDGELDTKRYRLPLWAFEVGKWAALLGLLVVVGFTAFAGPIMRSAASVPSLRREIARLEADNARVQQLAAALNRAESNYQSLRQLLGARAPAAADAPAGPALMKAVAVRAAPPSTLRPAGAAPRYDAGPSVPAHWPLNPGGYVTRGTVGPGDAGESHAGLDIAVPVGTPVRAAGGGRVREAGTDADYGLFVLLRHPDGYETMYGHASRLLVREGDDVQAGQVIALSGSSGRSTAPHLHFEVRRGGRSVDPRALVKEGG